MKIHHIGYLVKNIDQAERSFSELGYKPLDGQTYDPLRKVNICFMTKDGYTIELVSPTAVDSVVSGLLKRYRNSPYHICYVSSDFDDDVARLCEIGYTCIDEASPAVALGGKRVVFLMNAYIGMIELKEE